MRCLTLIECKNPHTTIERGTVWQTELFILPYDRFVRVGDRPAETRGEVLPNVNPPHGILYYCLPTGEVKSMYIAESPLDVEKQLAETTDTEIIVSVIIRKEGEE